MEWVIVAAMFGLSLQLTSIWMRANAISQDLEAIKDHVCKKPEQVLGETN